MKKTLALIFVLILSFYSKAGNLDTIATCNVYYNDSLIKSLTFQNDNLIVIKRKKYKAGDYLAIQYYDDMPCDNCNYNIMVRGEGKMEISNYKFRGKNKLVKIDLKELIDFHSKINNQLFVLFLYELDKKNINNGMRLLRIQID